MDTGLLYVVATPLGNLGDISGRALEVIAAADLVAVEDTRVAGRLLAHFGITGARLLSLHEHNEAQRVPELLAQISGGKTVALLSDAGTPLISDPGYRLVAAARAAGLRVSPVPGPSALVAALSAAGLPTDRFAFEGFPPARHSARLRHYQSLAAERRTLVFYESSHRIQASLQDLAEAFGDERQAVIARELTKRHEQIESGTLKQLLDWLAADSDHRRGEFVIVVAGAPPQEASVETAAVARVLDVLLAELPARQAVDLAARITGAPRQALYREAQRRKHSPHPP